MVSCIILFTYGTADVGFKEPDKNETLIKEIPTKELYPNLYQRIETQYVNFELPVEATHYWLDGKGDNDLYEVIIDKLEVDGRNYSLRLTWYAPRYQNDIINIDYNFKNGILYKENIVPYSKTGNRKTEFNNFNVETIEQVSVEKKQISNDSCIEELKRKTQTEKVSLTLAEYEKEVAKCQLIEVKPVYEVREFEPIVTTINRDFKAIDDILVSACGTLSTPNERYYLNGNITTSTTGTCLNVGADNIIIDGQGFWINGTNTGSSIGINSNTRNNITITNLNMVGFYRQIYFIRTNNSLVINSSFYRSGNNQISVFLTNSGTTGNNNITLRNLRMFRNNAYIGWYSRNITIENISIQNTDTTYSNIMNIQLNNETRINNINMTNSMIYLDTSTNVTITNIVASNMGVTGSAIRYISNNPNNLVYFENITINNATLTTDGSSPIEIMGGNEIYFRNVFVNNSKTYGISIESPFNYNITNVTFENLRINNTVNESINIRTTGSGQIIVIDVVNATYNNERVVRSSGIKAELNREWIASVKVNDTAGYNLSNIITYGNVSVLNDSEKLPDYSFDNPSLWNRYLDAQIEYGYMYVYNITSGGSTPHRGGSVSPLSFTPVAGKRYNITISDVDTSTSGVPLNVSMCGVSWGYNKGYYGRDTRVITCINTNPLNISVPPDNIGDGMGNYFAGITDYISVKSFDDITYDVKYTDANGNSRLFLAEYTNLNGVRNYYSNYTIYAFNSTYNSSQNMSTNRNLFFTLPQDAVPPFISFVSPTTEEGIVTTTYLFANVTANDTFPGLKNITIFLYNTTGLVSSQTSTSSPFFYNFTNLKPSNYTINATAFDVVGNMNKTSSRNYQLIDITPPNVIIIYPIATNYSNNVTAFTFNASDFNINSCWYDIGEGNVSVTCNTTITSITSKEGWNTWYAYANDTSGNIGSSSITFYVETLENITFCRTLMYPLTYQIRNNLTSILTSCLTIGSSNVTINGNGFSIISLLSGTYGIQANQKSNITILNIGSIRDFTYGIYFTNINISRIINSNLLNNNYGIYFGSSSDNYIESSNLINNSFGIYLSSSNRNNFTNLNIDASSYGFYTLYSNNNTINNSLIKGTTRDVLIEGMSGGFCYGMMDGDCGIITQQNACNEQTNICIWNQTTNSCQNIDISTQPLCSRFLSEQTCTGLNQNFYCFWYSYPNSPSRNNIFTNTIYNISKEEIRINSDLTRRWSYNAQVRDVYGNTIHNATVIVRDKNNTIITSMNTSYSGYTPYIILTDYINLEGNRVYFSPYNNTAYSNIPSGVYSPVYQLWNLTQQMNNTQIFLLTLNVSKEYKEYFPYNKKEMILTKNKFNKFAYNKLESEK